MATANVYFPEWAKIKPVKINAESRAVLRTLYHSDGVWYCCHRSATQALEPFLT